MSIQVDIKKKLGQFQLNVAFSAENEILALLGASGCGKSMTLKCIAGIETPDQGRIVLDGRVLFDSEKHINVKPQKRRAGYLFQQYALFPNMTVWQNIAAGLRDKKKAEEVLPGVIASMHLEGMEGKRPHELSGGQQQRVALARILVNEPDIVLLDEPFSALDSHLRFNLEQKVRHVMKEFGKTVLLVSHDRDEVFRLSDSIAIIQDGKIQASGSKKEVFRAPGTRAGAILTGCKNVSPIRKLDQRRVLALDWNMELDLNEDVGDAAYVGIRMHDICKMGDKNRFFCDIIGEIENPFSYTIMLKKQGEDSPSFLGWELDKQLWQELRMEPVTICLPPESILLLKE
jgi:molybdate transport system ATP-binding protein